jgi:hypothetical protein
MVDLAAVSGRDLASLGANMAIPFFATKRDRQEQN